MTRKQILKSIETATKNVAKFQKNVRMYATRRDNAILKAVKKGVNVSLDDFHAQGPDHGYFEVIPYNWTFYNENWEHLAPVTSNWESMLNNQYKADKELRKIESLNAELAQLDAEENHVTDLVATISEAMKDFKVEWFAKMQTWHDMRYKHIQKILPVTTARYKRMVSLSNRMEQQYKLYSSIRIEHFIHKGIYRRLNAKSRELSAIVYDNAATMTEEEYKAWALKEINREWDSNMRILVKKLEAFNINLSEVKVDGIDTTAKGFECYVTDGKNRTIYARMIWAAEYSMFVAPHTRYIITERH